MSITTLLLSLIIFIILSYILSKLAERYKENSRIVEACKVIISNRFYENFKHMTLGEKLKEVGRMKKLIDRPEIDNFLHQGREFKIAMKYYVAIMEHDIQLDMTLIKINNMITKMDEDESDNKEPSI